MKKFNIEDVRQFFWEKKWEYFVYSIAFLFSLICEIVFGVLILNLTLSSIIISSILKMITFIISFNWVRYDFPTTFHSDSFKTCISLSIKMFCCGALCMIIFPVNITVCGGLFSGILCCYVLYIAGKTKDYIIDLNTKDIYSMTEDELRNYAKSKHISENMIDTLVLRIIHNYKWVEIQQERNFTKDGIRYHKEQLNKKLNIKL